MADAFIYDHVRTPRGKGKKDGSLHEVTAVELGTTTLRALRDRNGLDTKLVEDVVFGCVDPVGEAGADIARTVAFKAGYGKEVPGIQINRFCASGLDAVNFGAAQVMSGQNELADRRRRREHEPRRHGRRAASGRSFGRHRHLLHAAGRLGRSDRDEVRLLARRCRRLRRRKPEARPRRLGGRAASRTR
jgi:hypothetical protein